jgi:hypothetical protein
MKRRTFITLLGGAWPRGRLRRAHSSACDGLLWESGMIRDTSDLKRGVMTQPLVVRNHKPWVVRNGLVFGGRARKFRREGRDWRAILHAWRA